MTLEDWQQYFNLPHSSEDGRSLRSLHDIYNGNAQAMKVLDSEIQNNYDGDIDYFWQKSRQDIQIEPFRFLVNNQLDRLRDQSADAYSLLCRLAACRDEDVEWFPDSFVRGLQQDVPTANHLQTIRRLCNCSLLQFHKGEYRIHPGIRAAAMISRLQESVQ